MNLALVSAWFPPDTPPETAARRTRDVGLSMLALSVPGPVEARREAFRTAGVDVCAVVHAGEHGASDGDFFSSCAQAVAAAAVTKAPRVVVEGGGFGPRDTKALGRAEGALRAAWARGETPDARDVLAKRRARREAATLDAVRTLHRLLAEGAPVAIRHGGEAGTLLAFDETEWALGELEGLSLAFDPARALRLHRLGLGPEPLAWAEAFAPRISLVFAHGLGSDLSGRSHPEDEPAPWREVEEGVPRRAPWLLDLAPTLAAADVEDAVRYLESQR